jgi:drug/metabolite transporter (DMT)-like permease
MKHFTNAYLALAFVCIVWGTTFLAIRVGVLHYPPFLFAAVRQTAAGLIIMLTGWLMYRKADLSGKWLWRQAKIGFLMITVGNGVVSWAEQYVPSGVTALVCAIMPIFTVVFNLMTPPRERLSAVVLTGMLTGLGGVALIFRDSISDLANLGYLTGILGLLVSTAGWALGSVIALRPPKMPVNALLDAGLQVTFGGIFLFCSSALLDDFSNFSWWQAEAFWSLVYLIIFGSVLAYTAYMYTLKKLPVGLATIYAYVNPLVAVVLGYWLMDEQLTIWTILSFILIVGSVFIVRQGYRKQKKTAAGSAVTATGVSYEPHKK